MQNLTISSQDIILYVLKTKPNHFFTDVPGCDMPFSSNLKNCSFWDASLSVAWKCHIEVSDLWMECICSFICNQVWIPASWLTLFCLQKKLRSVAHNRLLWAFHIGQGELSSSTNSQWNAVIFAGDIVHAMVLGILEYGLPNKLGIVPFYATSIEALLWTGFFWVFTW